MHLRVGSEPLVVRTSGASKLEPGDRTGVRIDPQQLHLFDPETGVRR